VSRKITYWFAAASGSILGHLAVLLLLPLTLKPEPVPQQPNPITKLEIEAYEVQKVDATAQELVSEAATSENSNGIGVNADPIPTSHAKSADFKQVGQQIQATAPDIQIATDAVDASSVALSSVPLKGQSLAALNNTAENVVADNDFAAEQVASVQVVGGAISEVPTPSEMLVSVPAEIQMATNAVVASSVALSSVPPAGQSLAPLDNTAKNAVAEIALFAEQMKNIQSIADVIDEVSAPAETLASLAAEIQSYSDGIEVSSVAVIAAKPVAQTIAENPAPAAVSLPIVSLLGDVTPPQAVSATPTSAQKPKSARLGNSATNVTFAVPATPPPSEKGVASLAWSGAPGQRVDSTSLATIQAFMRPGDIDASKSNAGEVRDGISNLLAQVPCSRLQVSFDPDTGSLDLRGHVSEADLRAPVLAALQAQVGDGIPVRDNMLILPRPQCGALAGIASVGLPQSTDQLTNPLMIGEDAHAREYEYGTGERLIFDLVAPDYDAFIYVDYFDANGQVLHLVPNETIPLTASWAQSVMRVGADAPDGSGLNLIIGPPYGQEIAVAFASSIQLYDGLRPLAEPAETYLAWLKMSIAKAREEVPDFKGEWVYFFITTSER
jgi:hypothetical protein